ncbi:MAG: hypothetical protein AAF446_07695 [Pseudomonadota bacterium]
MQSTNQAIRRPLRDQMIGKCISGVIARPGRDGEPPTVMMMQFDDGSVLEFVSPRSDRVLKQAVQRTRYGAHSVPGQLAFADI